jgi:hypothetical protein
MTATIEFLEALGASPAGAPLLAAGYAAAVENLRVDPAQRGALLDRNGEALSELLRGSAPMFCIIATPDEEDEPEELPDEPEQDEPSDDPDQGRTPAGG